MVSCENKKVHPEIAEKARADAKRFMSMVPTFCDKDSSKGKNTEFHAKYELVDEKPFASGWFAGVYKVRKRNNSRGKVFAAKIFKDGKSFGMKNEVAPLKLLDSPLTLKCEEIFESTTNNNNVLVLEYIEG